MKKQTAVEWYFQQTVVEGKTNYFELLKQAKKMEVQQVMISSDEIRDCAKEYFRNPDSRSFFILGAQWYREQIK